MENENEELKVDKGIEGDTIRLDGGDKYDEVFKDAPEDVIKLLKETRPVLGDTKEIEKIYEGATRRANAEVIRRVRREKISKDLNKLIYNFEDIMEDATENTEFNPDNEQEQVYNNEQPEENINEEDMIKIVKIADTPPVRNGLNVKKSDSERHNDEIKDLLDDDDDSENSGNLEYNLEGISMIKRQSENRKGKPRPKGKKIAGSSNNERSRRKKIDSNDEHEENKNKKRIPPINLDLNTITRQKDLNDFFADNSDDDDNLGSRITDIKGIKNVAIALISVCVIVMGVMVFRTVSLSGKLQKANAEITELEGLKEKNNTLNLEKSELEEEISSLKSRLGNYEEVDAPQEPQVSDNENTVPQDTPQVPNVNEASGDENYEMYTVVNGDTVWEISKKVYGNGAEYKRILDANGLSDPPNIKEGQQLKIPK